MKSKLINYLTLILKKYFSTINKIQKNKGKIVIVTSNKLLVKLFKFLYLKNFYIQTNYKPGIFTNNRCKPDLLITFDYNTYKISKESKCINIPIIVLTLPTRLQYLTKTQQEKFFFQFFYLLSYKLSKIAHEN